jgi:hypothetical protein
LEAALDYLVFKGGAWRGRTGEEENRMKKSRGIEAIVFGTSDPNYSSGCG